MDQKIIKIGGIENYIDFWERIYNSNKLIVTYGKIFKLEKTKTNRFKVKILKKRNPGNIGFVERGRYTTITESDYKNNWELVL